MGALYILSLAIAMTMIGDSLTRISIPYVGSVPPMARYLAYIIAIWLFFRPRDRWIIGVIVVILLVLSPLDPLRLVLSLLSVYLIGGIYSSIEGVEYVSVAKLSIGIPAWLVVYVVSAIAGYIVGGLLVRVLQWTPPLTGDAYAIVTVLRSTLLYRIMVIVILSALIYRVVQAVIDLAVALKARGEAARALIDIEYMRMRKQLLDFEGPQYTALEWSLSLLLTMFAAPLVYTAVTMLFQVILGKANIQPGLWTPVASALLATLISWIPLKFMASAMTRTVPVKVLLSKKQARRIASVIILSLIIIIPLLLAIQDPRNLLVEAVTGKQSGIPDPLSKVLSEPTRDYYRNLARLTDLIVKLFWGG